MIRSPLSDQWTRRVGGPGAASPCSPPCFQIPVQALVQFVEALEVGYSKYKNPYHNLIHAADVTQTAHFLMLHTGLMVTPPSLVMLTVVTWCDYDPSLRSTG